MSRFILASTLAIGILPLVAFPPARSVAAPRGAPVRALAWGEQHPDPQTGYLLPEAGKPLLDRMREFPDVLGLPPGEIPPGVLRRSAEKLGDLRRGDGKALLERARAKARRGVDTVRVVAVRVDFLKDSAGKGTSTPDGRFDLRSPEEARVPVDPPPRDRRYFESHLEALRRYYWHQSGGSLWLDYDVFPAESDSAYHLEDTEHYGPWIVSVDNPDLLSLAERFVRDALAVADTTDPALDFGRYDSFVIFHAGPDFQGDINRDSPYDIPSFNLFLSDPVALEDSTVFVDLIMVVPETVSQDGFLGALNGVVAHEFGHQLGFFDLYDIFTFLPAVGMFSLMDSGDNTFGVLPDPYRNDELVFVRGAVPASLDPWHKYLFFQGGNGGPGISFHILEEPGEVSVDAVLPAREVLLLPLNLEEWYLIENRPFDLNGDATVVLRADSTTGVILGPEPPEDAPGDSLAYLEYDYLLPGEGILVWHIDWQAIADGLSLPYGGINVLRDRKGVFVEEADGIPDLGDIFSPEWTGGPYDYWFVGAYSHFGPETDPATLSNHGTPTFLSVEILDPPANSMRLSWGRGWIRTFWPQATGAPLGWGGVLGVDLDGDGELEVLATGAHGIAGWNGDGSAHAWVTDREGVPLWAVSEDSLQLALVWNPEFAWDGGGRGAIAALSRGGRLHLWDAQGRLARSVWPDSFVAAQTPRILATSPVLLDSIAVVGGEDGRIRGLRPAGAQGEPELRWRLDTGGGAITALGAGDLDEDGRAEIFWATQGGQVGVASGWQRGPMRVAPGWPVTVEPGRAVDDVVGIVPRPSWGEKGDPGGLWALDARGRIHRWTIGRAGAREGEARQVADLGEAPAGHLAFGDVDGDTQLETIVPLASGRIAVRGLDGSRERGYPVDLWSPDEEPSGDLHGPPLVLRPEEGAAGLVIVPRPRGDLAAIEAGGMAWGWPQTLGYEIGGALWAGDLEGDGDLEIVVGDAQGWVTLVDVPRAWAEPSGAWGLPGADAARTRFLGPEDLPLPDSPASPLVAGPVRIYPNPARGEEAFLDLAVRRPSRVRMTALDTEGRTVREWRWRTEGGPDGSRLAFATRELAPGFYICRISVESQSETFTKLEKLAVIR